MKCTFLTMAPVPVYGKIVFHEIDLWCQKGWGPLTQKPEGTQSTAGVGRTRVRAEATGVPHRLPLCPLL